MQRRNLIKHSLGAALSGPALIPQIWGDTLEQGQGPTQAPKKLPPSALKRARVVVVGGGYAGTTACKYLSLFSNHQIQVTLIEPDAKFISCPLSNLVIGGSKQISDVTLSYETLQKNHGTQIIKDRVSSIDSVKKTVSTAAGLVLPYDELILSPGVELIYSSVLGLLEAKEQGKILQAWGSGGETQNLRLQLESLKDGEIFAITVPELPYRCPPGPYERASQVAYYFKHFKPKSKVLILDANQDVTSKGALFKKFWRENYPEHLEYRPEHKVLEVDAKTNTLKFEIQEDLRAGLLNVLPPMRAGAIAVQTGLANINKRWCEVNFLNFESTVAPHIHVLGDSIQAGPYMPKSAHMANAHAKVAAAAVVAKLAELELNSHPFLTNTCYSFVDPKQAIYIASVHQYDSAEKTFKILPNAGGMSSDASEREGNFAFGWAKNIWADCLT